MKRIAVLVSLGWLALAVPAHATGGLHCSTAGEESVVIDLGFGHVPSAGLFLARLSVRGQEIAVTAPQWWMRDGELRLALVSSHSGEEEAVVSAQWNEDARAYDGRLTRDGRSHWVRCREA